MQIISNNKLWTTISPGLFQFKDSCNVYVLKSGNEAVAIDFGSGRWQSHLGEIGVERIQHVLLTHVHRDQMYGLSPLRKSSFLLHVPSGDEPYLVARELKAFWRSYQAAGCPANYSAPVEAPTLRRARIGEANDLIWSGGRITAIPTPGHTRGALTYLTVWRGKQIAFCGDALTADGTIHEPFHLEWDHWTGEGASQAWNGLERLSGSGIDLLCPSHGKMGRSRCVEAIRKVQGRLRDFIRAKGSVCEGERDRWFPVTRIDDQTLRISDHLLLFGANTYVLTDDADQALIIDPTLPSIRNIRPLLKRLSVNRVTLATSTHFHRDHSDGLNWVREHLGAEIRLHPRVAEPLKNRDRFDLPWLPADSVAADRRLPESGIFRWSSYTFRIRSFPGQTWWHCAFDTEIDGKHVLFSGDNFQPPSRWNGTGGFCSFNGCRMTEGFARSAQTVLDLAPDLICNGHGCVYTFAPGHYRKILRWAARSEKAIRALEAKPQGFDFRNQKWEPFRSSALASQRISLTYYVTNPSKESVAYACKPHLPSGWVAKPEIRRVKVAAGKTRMLRFEIQLPPKVPRGRKMIAAEVTEAGQLIGQPAVAIVDVA